MFKQLAANTVVHVNLVTLVILVTVMIANKITEYIYTSGILEKTESIVTEDLQVLRNIYLKMW